MSATAGHTDMPRIFQLLSNHWAYAHIYIHVAGHLTLLWWSTWTQWTVYANLWSQKKGA
jgi:hypothetical protein